MNKRMDPRTGLPHRRPQAPKETKSTLPVPSVPPRSIQTTPLGGPPR